MFLIEAQTNKLVIFASRLVKNVFDIAKLWNTLLIWKVYWGVEGECMNISFNFNFVHLDCGYQLTRSLLQHFFNAYWSFINIIEGVLYSLPQRSYNLNWQFRRIISLFQELEHSKISDLLKVTWNVQKPAPAHFPVWLSSILQVAPHFGSTLTPELPGFTTLSLEVCTWPVAGLGVAGQPCCSCHCSLLTVAVIHGTCFYGAN